MRGIESYWECTFQSFFEYAAPFNAPFINAFFTYSSDIWLVKFVNRGSPSSKILYLLFIGEWLDESKSIVKVYELLCG